MKGSHFTDSDFRLLDFANLDGNLNERSSHGKSSYGTSFKKLDF